MRIRLLNLLLLSILVLAVSRLWLFLGEPPPALPAISTAPEPTAPESAEVAPQPEVPESRPEEFDVIVARDLFSSARGVVPPAPAAATKPAARQQPPPKLTLFGVVIIDGEKTAYLQEGTQESRPRKVRENENFAGGVVKTIRPDGITFLFADAEINVPLRTPKDVAGAPSPRGQVPAPVAPPRRLTPPGGQQVQMPVPGRPARPAPRMPAAAPPEDLGGEVFEDEEFPEEFLTGEEEADPEEDEAEE